MVRSRWSLSAHNGDRPRWLLMPLGPGVMLLLKRLLKTPRDDKDESIKAISQEALTLRCLALKELVKLYLDLGHLEKAQDWLQAAEAICCEKDIFRKMYLEMLKACASKGNLMKAEKIFFQAHKAFKGFQDLTFYTLMVGCCWER